MLKKPEKGNLGAFKRRVMAAAGQGGRNPPPTRSFPLQPEHVLQQTDADLSTDHAAPEPFANFHNSYFTT